LFTKLNISFGLFLWALSCSVVLLWAVGVEAGAFSTSLSMAEVDGSLAEGATSCRHVLVVFLGSNASIFNCFLLLVVDLLGCFNVKGSDVKLEVHDLASYSTIAI
jgi:hypothetical protein